MRWWIIIAGLLLLPISVFFLLWLSFGFFPSLPLYCYGGGVETFTQTLGNGSVVTHIAIATPACGGWPNIGEFILDVLAIPFSVFAIFYGVFKK